MAKRKSRSRPRQSGRRRRNQKGGLFGLKSKVYFDPQDLEKDKAAVSRGISKVGSAVTGTASGAYNLARKSATATADTLGSAASAVGSAATDAGRSAKDATFGRVQAYADSRRREEEEKAKDAYFLRQLRYKSEGRPLGPPMPPAGGSRSRRSRRRKASKKKSSKRRRKSSGRRRH